MNRLQSSVTRISPGTRADSWGASAGAVGLTLGNAIELTLDRKDDLFNLVLLAATAIAVSRFHVSLLLVLEVFGTAGMWRYRARKTRSIP